MSNAEFSIVIPYHAHPSTLDFVKRQLNYYHNDTTNFQVILAVTGDETVKSQLAEFNATLNDSRFSILSTTETDITNWEAFLHKLAIAIKTVTTPYVIINGADDVVIPEAAIDGCKILTEQADIAAVKGYTVCLDYDTSDFLILNDYENTSNSPLERIKEAFKDRDSIFYIIRRTSELSSEYENILNLLKRSPIVRKSPYHIEHFKALCLASSGKVRVFKYPWRIYNRHKNNHTSHTEAAYLRVELGIIDKEHYKWFQSVNQNLQQVSYTQYKYLWILHQIRGISITYKQLAYKTLYRKCSFINALKMSIYVSLHKVYMFVRKFYNNYTYILDSSTNFFKPKHYASLKQYYFSAQDINLIETKVPQ